MTNYSYDKVTSAAHLHIEATGQQVRLYLAEGKLGDAQSLAFSVWGAFRLWKQITRGDQKDGDALRLEQAIEKLQAEANPPIREGHNAPSPVIQMLDKWVRGAAVGEEALYRMQQFGYVYPNEQGQLMLTPAGKQTLKENGLA